MENRKLQLQRDTILKQIETLENDAQNLASTDMELDQVFTKMQEHLQKKYHTLKNEARSGSSASTNMLNEICRLKTDAQSSNPNILKKVYTRVSELKAEMLFAPTPPKIDISSVLAAVENINIGDNDRYSPELPPPAPAHEQVHSRAPNFAPFSSTKPPFQESKHSIPDPEYNTRSSRQTSQTSDRHSTRDVIETRSQTDKYSARGADTRSQTDARSHDSHHSPYRPSDRDIRQPTPRPSSNSVLSPTLLTPADFSASQHSNQTIETRDTSITPERPPHQRIEPETVVPRAEAMPVEERSRPTHLAQEERSWSASREPVSTPAGPKIIDLCKNKNIRRYFTEFTDFTNPLVENLGIVEELYNPSCFFLKSLKVDNTRDVIQIKVLNYIEGNPHGLVSQKSHSLGKLVLCKFSRDNQWYRACIFQQHPDYEYTVLFIDYGNKERASYTQLYDLPETLQYEVMCVQQCYLAGITPADPKQEIWDESVNAALWEMVANRTLKIEVQQASKQIYGVTLKIVENGNSVNINQKLVEMGYAKIVEDSSANEEMKGLCTSPTRFAGFQQTARSNLNNNRHVTPPRRVASPPRRVASPPRRVASPPRRVASPPRRVASPPRRVASPPRRVASPPRRAASPPRRAASPPRRAASPPITRKPGRCRSPPPSTTCPTPSRPSTRAPHSPREPLVPRTEPAPLSSSSSDGETPSVGRPPSFGSAHQPFGGAISSPTKNSFGSGSVGRGAFEADKSAFGVGTTAKGRGNLKNFDFRFG